MAIFTNQAMLSYTGGSILSNIVTGEIAEAVTVVKTAVSASYTPGGRAAYAVSIANDGTQPVTGVTLIDDLGAYEFDGATVFPLAYAAGSLRYFVDGVLQTAPAVTAGPPLSVSGITVPPGSSAMLIYEAQVTRFAPLGAGAEITNTVPVDGSCIVAPLTASASISMEMAPQLSISKSVSPELITGCTEIRYTFVIQNAGGEAGGAENVSVADVFDPVLTGLIVTLNDAPFAAYTYDESTGVFTTAAGAITVPGATYSQNSDGSWMTTPGIAVLELSGTLR